MKWLKKIALAIAGFFTLLILAGFAIIFFYGDAVKEFIVDELQDHFVTDIEIKDIHFSVFSSFPYASVELEGVMIKELPFPNESADTLAYFETVYLNFNLIDILKENYRLKKVTLDDGFTHMRVNQDGLDNYHVWKSSPNESSDFLVELDDVLFDDIHFTYQNTLKKENFIIHGREVSFTGAFSSETYQLDLTGELFVKEFRAQGANYLRHRMVDLDTRFKVDQTAGSLEFERGRMVLDQALNFDISGTILADGLDLRIQGHKLDMESAKALLTPETRKSLANYESRGIIDFDAELKGAFNKTEAPNVKASFGIQNGVIALKNSPYELKSVQLAGSFTNGEKRTGQTSVLEIDRLTAQLGHGKIDTRFRVENFDHPRVIVKAEGGFPLDEFLHFMHIDTVQDAQGDIALNLDYKGRIENPETFTVKDFQRSSCKGDISLKKASGTLVGSGKSLADFNGKLHFTNNNIRVDDLSGKVDDSDFKFKGTIYNFLSGLFMSDQDIVVDGRFTSNNLHIDPLLPEESSGTTAGVPFPEGVEFRVRTRVNKLSYKEFEARNVVGKLRYSSRAAALDNLSFNAIEGYVRGDVELVPEENGYSQLYTSAEVHGINLRELFAQFKDFDQEVVRGENLRGKATVKGDFSARVTPDLDLVSQSITSSSDITVSNGELIGFEAMQDITDYLKTRKLLSKFLKVDELGKKLQHIHFTTLTNHIDIKNEVISIPKMSIYSSAMDIEIGGNHTFENQIDYLFSFNLGDLFTLHNSLDNYKFLEREDGRSRIYLRMTGDAADPDIKMEEIFIKNPLNEIVAQETQSVKEVLNKEWGMFKNDPSLQKEPEKPKEVDYGIEWSEAPELNVTPEAPAAPSPKKSPEPTKKKGLGKWVGKLNEKETKKKEEPELDFSDDDY